MSFWKPGGFDSILKKFKKEKSYSTTSVPSSRPPLKERFDLQKLKAKLGVPGLIVVSVFAILSIVFLFMVVRPSYKVFAQVKVINEDVRLFEEALKNQDLEAVKGTLEKGKNDIAYFRDVRDKGGFGWTRNFAFTKDYYSDSEHFINAGLILVDGLSEFVVVVDPFTEAAGFKKKVNVEVVDPNAGSGLAEAIAAWVRVMPEVADKMDGVIEKIDMVGEEVSSVDPNRYPESLSGFPIKSNIEAAQQYLARASEFGPDIKAALTIIPPMLGVGGAEKRYAIIMQNEAEIRATGGFWTSFATFKVKNATLSSDFTTNDMYSIDLYISYTDTPWTQPWPLPTAPYRDFLKVEHTWGRDANFSPDYPTSVDYWLTFYQKAAYAGHPSAKPLNGVFAMDTKVLSELLKVTGPVSVNGFTYDSESVVLELEKLASLTLAEQAGRKKVLGDVMEEMLFNMYRSERNLWPKFIETAVRLAIEKDILVYVLDDPKAQELLDKYNFSGRIINTNTGDYSYVVSTNLAGDKTNFFVNKAVDHKIFKESDRWVHEVTIDYSYGQPKPGYEAFANTYRDWVRVYAPAGSTLISLEGSDATTSEDLGEERGKVYFAGHITLPPNEQRTIKFKYEIPASLTANGTYKLYLQKQPGTLMDKHTVTINGKTQTAELVTDKELTFSLK